MANKKIHQLPTLTDEQVNDDLKLWILGDPTTGQLFKVTVAQLKLLFSGGGSQDLQSVTAEGNTTDQTIISSSGFSALASNTHLTAVAVANASTAEGVNLQAGNGSSPSLGYIKSGHIGQLFADNISATRLWQLPNASGNLALAINTSGAVVDAGADYADDAAAAAGDIPVHGLYHTSGAVKIRLS